MAIHYLYWRIDKWFPVGDYCLVGSVGLYHRGLIHCGPGHRETLSGQSSAAAPAFWGDTVHFVAASPGFRHLRPGVGPVPAVDCHVVVPHGSVGGGCQAAVGHQVQLSAGVLFGLELVGAPRIGVVWGLVRPDVADYGSEKLVEDPIGCHPGAVGLPGVSHGLLRPVGAAHRGGEVGVGVAVG